MTDIMQDWKNHKFIVVGHDLFDEVGYNHMVIMTDVAYWAEHVDECLAWCSLYKCMQKGMTIAIPNEETLALFLLKWS